MEISRKLVGVMEQSSWTTECGMVFIILHDEETGHEIMVNPRAIEVVFPYSRINFQGYSVHVRESYDEIKELIIKAMKVGV